MVSMWHDSWQHWAPQTHGSVCSILLCNPQATALAREDSCVLLRDPGERLTRYPLGEERQRTSALRSHFARSTEYHLSEEAAGVCKYCCEFHECLIATVVSFFF